MKQVTSSPLSARLPAAGVILFGGCLLLCCGCSGGSSSETLDLSKVIDVPNLSQMATQASFRAKVAEIHVIVETDNRPANTPSNAYQLVLRDQDGDCITYAGVDAPIETLELLQALQTNQYYVFPDVLDKAISANHDQAESVD